MGNDDYTPTKRMTGGTIPALAWHNIMAYAHQGVELRPLPGLPPAQHAPTVADAALVGAPPAQQILLTRKGTDALVHVERLLDEASRAMPLRLGSTTDDESHHPGTLTAASELKTNGLSHGD
jgi:penicillin-binding protein 1A